MRSLHTWTRREFLTATTASTALALSPAISNAADSPAAPPESVCDIHQHTNYHGRTDEELLSHQRAMGVTHTLLLPAGRPVDRPSTHNGKSNGLAAMCGGNESVVAFSRAHPGEFFYGANEVTDLPEAREEIEKFLKMGAKIIGEQKFSIECDSKYIEMVAGLAQEYSVPVLMHFQHKTYNLGIERFHTILEKYPKVNFIGHAQTWWANIDKDNNDQAVMYPKTKVTPGGLTEQLLSNYPNMYGDHSAGSGFGALIRDEDHARWFIAKHQNQLLYGSDCADKIGRGPGCDGARILAAIRRLAPDKAAERKILFENSKRLFKL